MSTARRTPGIHLSPTPRGPNGERLCRNCSKVLTKGQRHNCSPECSDAWMCKTSPSHLRYRLSQRDRGICAICKVDTVAQKKEYEARRDVLHANTDHRGSTYAVRAEILSEYGVPSSRARGDWWDADHITPVIEGGGECGLENFRTLCIPCHKRVTKDLAGRMAARRHEQKAVANDSRGMFADQVA